MNKPLLLAGIILVSSLAMTNQARAMDSVRVESRIDTAIARWGVTGSGVAVAIMDRGIDWRSNDFRNDNGTTRIAWIFDLTDDTGMNWPNNPYGKGTIYSRATIDSALLGQRTLTFRDAVGHGSTTNGIAVGNGRNSTNRKWRGVAPNATIVCIKITSDGAPAHGNEPPEAPFYDPARIPLAINFARDKAVALSMPCVMLLNLGSQGGPTDGTSDLCRKIDSTVGAGKRGLAFVTGPGDDGGNPNRASFTIPSGQFDTLKIRKAAAGSLFLDLWYAGNDRFDVTIKTPTTTFGPYPSPATNNDNTFISNTSFVYYHLGSNVVFYGARNGKREIYLRIDGAVGDYQLIMRGATIVNGRYDVTLNPSSSWNPTFRGNIFLNHVAAGSIWDGATAFNNISPGCYNIRTQWVDIDGVARSILDQGSVGQLWTGSSVGPTFDGRLGVDLAAPGQSIVTSYGPNSYWATFRFNLIQNGNGVYGMAGAVSAAAPIVTGVIALMLQMNPQLDAIQIRNILRNSARADGFTGTTPNTRWGYGKLNALEALRLTSLTVDVRELKTPPGEFALEQNYPNPFNPTTKIRFTLSSQERDGVRSFVSLKVYDVLGREVATLVNENLQPGSYQTTFSGEGLASGAYFYRLTSGGQSLTKKLLLTK